MERGTGDPPASSDGAGPAPPVPLAVAARVWLRIGLTGFGGPAGQIALMHRLLVEERRWIGEARFLNALNYCMLLPGPEAQQLATYIGWLLHRTLGGVIAGTLFVLPGAIAVLLLSIVYAEFQRVEAVEALFYGVKPAVLAIVCEALVRIGRRALRHGWQAAVAALAFVCLFLFDLPFPLVVVGAGVAGWALAERASRPHAERPAARPSLLHSVRVLAIWLPLWLLPVGAVVALLGADHVFAEIATFFSKMAVVTFGGAYAVLAYVAQQAVDRFAWLGPSEMLDGLGLAETTPGPLILVLQFVGFMAAYREAAGIDPLLAGVMGAALATWVTFAPCFLWIFLGAPYIEALQDNRRLNSALSGITAAVVGVVFNLALWFALHTVFARVVEWRSYGLRLLLPDPATLDPIALLLASGALFAMFRLRLGLMPTLALTAGVGAALYWILKA